MQKSSVLLLDKRLQSLVDDYVPDDDVLQEVACFFNVFSDLTRLKMLSALAISEMCVTDLSSILCLNQLLCANESK